MKALAAIIARDLRLAYRERGELGLVVLFFLLVAALFPFGVGPEPNLLLRIGIGVIWVSALLSLMLSFERLFLADYEDGSLEVLALGPLPLEAVVLAKALAHWIVGGLPVILAAPLIGLFYGLPAEPFWVILPALALGTPILSLFGAIGAALTLGARRGGILIPLLILPLTVPVLILGVLASEAAMALLPARPYLLILGGLLLAAIPLTPLAAAAAIRHALE